MPEQKKLQYAVDAELHTRFATVATGLNMTGAEAIAQAMRAWIEANKKAAGLR